MSQNFKAGDVCILQNCDFHPEYNGLEVTLLTNFSQFRCFVSGDVVRGYKVDLTSPLYGKHFYALPHQLRRKEPPKPAREIDTPVSWSDCAWKPSGVAA